MTDGRYEGLSDSEWVTMSRLIRKNPDEAMRIAWAMVNNRALTAERKYSEARNAVTAAIGYSKSRAPKNDPTRLAMADQVCRVIGDGRGAAQLDTDFLSEWVNS